MDLIDVGNISEQNRGVKYLLCCVDVFSRYGWVIPLKSKTAESVSEALTFFLNVTPHIPTNLTSDHRGKFVNEKVCILLKKFKVNFRYSISENKCSIVEIFQKTLQRKIYAFLTDWEQLNYITNLQNFVMGYTHFEHSFFKCHIMRLQNLKILN